MKYEEGTFFLTIHEETEDRIIAKFSNGIKQVIPLARRKAISHSHNKTAPCIVSATATAPFGAGSQQVMDIKGNGFGSGGIIQMPNVDDGGATMITIQSDSTRWIRSWNDTLIQVVISSLAPGAVPMGSGTWIIDPDASLSCVDTVEIEFSMSVNYEAPYEMLNSIATNTYASNYEFNWFLDSIGITTDSSLQAQGISYSDVLSVCKEAFCDWEMASGLEFTFAGINNSGQNAMDEKYTITIGRLDSSILASTKSAISLDLCDTLSEQYVDGRLSDADIIIDNKRKWFVSTGPAGISSGEYDLYSVLLHEIGHLLQLEHAMDIDSFNGTNDDRLMFARIKEMQIKRNIDAKTINGINLQKIRSQHAILGCLDGYVLNTMTTGCVTPVDNLELMIEVSFTNPLIQDQELYITSSEVFNQISIHDISGRLITHSFHHDSTVVLPGLQHSGTYIVILSFNGFKRAYKLLVL